jgi:hypothetical protein
MDVVAIDLQHFFHRVLHFFHFSFPRGALCFFKDGSLLKLKPQPNELSPERKGHFREPGSEMDKGDLDRLRDTDVKT